MLIGGRYTLVEQIGQGGMGEVWLARDEGPDGYRKTVVIKRMLPEASRFVEYFKAEARLVAALPHQNIVQVIGFFKDDRNQYNIVMEYVEGADLFDLIFTERGQLSVDMAVYIAAEALKGLDFAHTARIDGKHASLIHRDISPHNVLVSYGAEVKLTDFGVAKASLEWRERTEGPAFRGKFAYAPPEAIDERADIDHRVDIYSMGVVLWEMLAKKRAFSGSMLETILQVKEGKVPSLTMHNPQVPPALAHIVQKMMHPVREERFQTAAEARAALVQAMPSWAIADGPLKEFVRVVRRKSRRSSPFITSADLGGIATQIKDELTKRQKGKGESPIPTFTGDVKEDSAPEPIFEDKSTHIKASASVSREPASPLTPQPAIASGAQLGNASTMIQFPTPSEGVPQQVAGPDEHTMAARDITPADPSVIPTLPPNEEISKPTLIDGTLEAALAGVGSPGKPLADRPTQLHNEVPPLAVGKRKTLPGVGEPVVPSVAERPTLLAANAPTIVPGGLAGKVTAIIDPSSEPTNRIEDAALEKLVERSRPRAAAAMRKRYISYALLLLLLFILSAMIGLWLVPPHGDETPAHETIVTPTPPQPEAQPAPAAPQIEPPAAPAAKPEAKPELKPEPKPTPAKPAKPKPEPTKPKPSPGLNLVDPVGSANTVRESLSNKPGATGKFVFKYSTDEKVKVSIDDQPIGVRPPSFELGPGPHSVTLIYPSSRKVMNRYELSAGSSITVDVTPSK